MTEVEAIGRCLSYPMLAVAAASADARDACLVGFSTQISIDPWRYLVGISHRNRTYALAQTAAYVAVHFLESDQHELARLLGESSEHGGPSKEARLAPLWRVHETGAVRLAPCRCWFVARVLDRHDCGDHSAFVVEPVAGSEVPDDFRQLDFQSVRDLGAGRAP